MKKIQKVIETCYECEFCKKFEQVKSDSVTAYICTFENDDELSIHEPFLLDLNKYKGSNQIYIPKNCPLETYNELNENRT